MSQIGSLIKCIAGSWHPNQQSFGRKTESPGSPLLWGAAKFKTFSTIGYTSAVGEIAGERDF